MRHHARLRTDRGNNFQLAGRLTTSGTDNNKTDCAFCRPGRFGSCPALAPHPHPPCLQFAQNTLIARIHHHQNKVTERGGTKKSRKRELPPAYPRSSPHLDRRGGSSPRCEQSSDICENFHALTTQQEDLRADVRVEAERKLKALEADLATGERANKERALATRYHKVKFFGALCCVVLHIVGLTKIIRSSEARA